MKLLDRLIDRITERAMQNSMARFRSGLITKLDRRDGFKIDFNEMKIYLRSQP